MILNSVNFSKISFANLNKTPKIQNKSFGDRFDAAKIESFEFSSNLSKEAKSKLISEIRYIINNQSTTTPFGYGATGVVFQIKDVEGLGHNGAIAKISYTQDKNPYTGEKQKIRYDYENEIKILRQLQVLKDSTQQYLGKIKLKDGRTILITTFVEGAKFDVALSPLNEEALKSAFGVLFELDSLGILHRDLKRENIVVDKNNQTKLIDFGEAVEFDILNFSQQEENNFPSFVAPTNLQNFEDTFISPYLNDLLAYDPHKAEKFLENYLTLKSDLIFSKRASELEEYLNKNKDSITQEEIQKLQVMIDYQKTMAAALSKRNLSPEIINIELLKSQVSYMSELAYKNEVLIGNPLANIALKANALICAKKLEAEISKQIKRPNKTEIRKYLEYQLQNSKYRQNKIASWLNGLVGWLTTCLCGDIDTQDENKQKIIKECLKTNLEDFEIPNIAQKYKERRKLDETI